MNLLDGERLLITIDREVDGACLKCGGYDYKVPCDACHGTGRTTKRVRGWCEVEVECDFQDHWSKYVVDVPAAGKSFYAEEFELEDIRTKLIAAYLDGTLPPEIAVNIEMEDV